MSTILIVGPAHPLRGGIATFNERLARAFQAEGHEVEILTFSLQYPGFLFPGTSQYTDEPAPKDLKITAALNSVNPLSWFLAGTRFGSRRYDVVLIRFWLPFMGPCLGTVARMLRRKSPIVALTDNVIPHEKRPGDTVFTRYFLSACDAFMAMSHSVLNDLRKFQASRPQVYYPHPVYDNYGQAVTRQQALQKIGASAESRYVLFFGFIRAYKGLDILLNAFADGRLKQRNIKLIIAGEFYEDQAKYEQLIRDHDLEAYIIRATHFIPAEEVTYYFSAADLVVQPYKSATQSGVSQVAYHFEKPVVVTDVGGLAELIPHGKVGYVVPVDEKAITDAIVDFYDHNREAEFIENIKLEKQKYSWEGMAKAILQLAEKRS